MSKISLLVKKNSLSQRTLSLDEAINMLEMANERLQRMKKKPAEDIRKMA